MSYGLEDAQKFNSEHSVLSKQKFNHFLVGLTFSLLALVIKFNVKTDLLVPHIIEIMGSFFLLISAVLGFFLLREESTFFSFFADIQGERRKLEEDKTNNKEVLAGYLKRIENMESFFNGKDSQSGLRYKIQIWSFFAGVVSIFISYIIPKIYWIFQKCPTVETALLSLQ